MVRRGSTVRVRQRALQKRRTWALSRSGRLAPTRTCGRYGAVHGAFAQRLPSTVRTGSDPLTPAVGTEIATEVSGARGVRVYAAQRKPVASGRGASGLAGRPPGGSSSLPNVSAISAAVKRNWRSLAIASTRSGAVRLATRRGAEERSRRPASPSKRIRSRAPSARAFLFACRGRRRSRLRQPGASPERERYHAEQPVVCALSGSARSTDLRTNRTPHRQKFIAVISRRHQLPQATRGEKVAG